MMMMITYPLQALPTLGLSVGNAYRDARLLSEQDLVTIQGIFVWMQVMAQTQIPTTTRPSYSELWWILHFFCAQRTTVGQMRSFAQEMHKEQLSRFHEALRDVGLHEWTQSERGIGWLHFDNVSFGVDFGDRVMDIKRVLLLNSDFDHHVLHLQRQYDFPRMLRQQTRP